MPRRNKKEDSTVSLFSFLDIIACLIGVLTLILIVLILSMVDPTSVEAAEKKMAAAKDRAQRMVQVQQQIEQLKQQQQELEQTVKQTQETQQRIEEIQERIAQVESSQEGAAEERKMARELQQQLKELKEQQVQLEKQQQEMQQKIESLETEVTERTKAAAEPVVRITPGGTGENINPFFVEVTAKDIAIYGAGPEPARVPPGQIANGPDFKQLVGRVQATPNGTMIFLIRPDAFNMYNLCNHVATNIYRVRNGKLPVLGQGEIDLSQFADQVQSATE